jgi:hypothetical protein
MRVTDARSYTKGLRAWLDADDRNWETLCEYIYRKALSPHLAFFRLMIEKVDGPVDPESAPGRMYPDSPTLVLIGDGCSLPDASVAA